LTATAANPDPLSLPSVKLPDKPAPPQVDTAAAAAEIEKLAREAKVKGVLDAIQRFRGGYVNQDVQAIRSVWPTRSSAELARIREGFQMTRSTKLTLQPIADPQISGDSATLTCRRSLIVELKDGSRPKPVQDQVTFRLQQSGSSWTIISMQ